MTKKLMPVFWAATLWWPLATALLIASVAMYLSLILIYPGALTMALSMCIFNFSCNEIRTAWGRKIKLLPHLEREFDIEAHREHERLWSGSAGSVI